MVFTKTHALLQLTAFFTGDQLKDQGSNPQDIQDNFGLYDVNYQEKPAKCLTQQAITLIRDSLRMDVERPFPDLFVVRSVTAHGLRLVAWTTSPQHSATLRPAPNATFSARRLCGANISAAAGAPIAVQSTPVVIDLLARTAASFRLTYAN